MCSVTLSHFDTVRFIGVQFYWLVKLIWCFHLCFFSQRFLLQRVLPLNFYYLTRSTEDDFRLNFANFLTAFFNARNSSSLFHNRFSVVYHKFSYQNDNGTCKKLTCLFAYHLHDGHFAPFSLGQGRLKFRFMLYLKGLAEWNLRIFSGGFLVFLF